MSFLSKIFREKKTTSVSRQSEMEICVECGATTSIPVSMPIDMRPNFVSGCGQLCPECFSKLGSSLDDEATQLVSAVLGKNEENA